MYQPLNLGQGNGDKVFSLYQRNTTISDIYEVSLNKNLFAISGNIHQKEA